MTTVAGSINERRPSPDRSVLAFKVSAYERVASLLLALLILIGAVVFLLLVAWLGMRILSTPLQAVPVTLEQVGGGMPSGEIGQSMQLDSPTPQDIPQESDLVEPELEETLAAVIEAVATREADLDDPVLSEQFEETRGGGRQIGTGDRAGFGSGEGRPGVPPQDRWEILFAEGSTLAYYARQLDFFGIELGVLGATNQVIFAKNLSQPKPDAYTGPRGGENRLYMSWRHGQLKEADRELLERAGVPAAGRILLQFYPQATEQLLLQVEQAYKNRKASEIRKTRFGIRPAGNGFEFYVIDQTYL